MIDRHTTHQRLIDAAAGLVFERGFHAVGVQEICRAARVNKGSFYHFFSSKEKLIVEVIRTRTEADLHLIEAAVSGDDPPMTRLARIFEHLRRQGGAETTDCGTAGSSEVGWGLLGRMAAESSDGDQPIRQAVQQGWEQLANAIEPVIAEAVELGALPALDTRRAAHALLAYIEAVLLFARTWDEAEWIDRLGSMPFDLLAVFAPRLTVRTTKQKPRVRLITRSAPG